jgi:hypothetical protein
MQIDAHSQTEKHEHPENEIESLRGRLSIREEEVFLLKTRLTAVETQSSARLSALECLSYVTKLPSCGICFERLDGPFIWFMLHTTCGNYVCTGCWKQYSRVDKSLADTDRQKRCPWNTCMLRDEAGNTVKRRIGGELVGVVGPCSIASEFTRDDALERIVHMRTCLANKYKDKIVPNVFDCDDLPIYVSRVLST